jgi:hypothetical protein
VNAKKNLKEMLASENVELLYYASATIFRTFPFNSGVYQDFVMEKCFDGILF